MSSSRAARVIAGLGASSVLAATGLVLAGPADATTPSTVSADSTYNCSLSGLGSAPVDVTFTIPAAAFPASVPVGTRIPAIPVSAQSNMPGTLVGAVVEGMAIAGASAPDVPIPTALTGAITGDASFGSQSLPTSLSVATPLTDLLSQLGEMLSALPGFSGLSTLGDLSDVANTIGLSTLATDVAEALPNGVPLTDGTSATPTINGTIKSFAVSKVGKQSFKLPSAISADLLHGVLPATPCTYASGTQTVGSVNVVKDASAFKSASVAGKKLKVTVANASKTALKPTGTVVAYRGSKKVGSGALHNGVASLGLKGLKAGKNKLTLKYAGSSLFKAAKSRSLTLIAR